MADYSIFNDAEQEYKRLSDTLRARVSECGDSALLSSAGVAWANTRH